MAPEYRLTAEQQEALWRWKWLGWNASTPGFKATMYVLLLIATGMLVYLLR